MAIGEVPVRRSASVSEIHHTLAPLIREHKKHYTIKKSTSTAHLSRSLADTFDRHKWTGSERHYRDYDLWDSYWWDRRFYMSPLYWPFAKGPGKRYNYVDPPTALWWYYPGTWQYPRYATSVANNDQLDALYWNRWRDPSYDRAWYRPWKYDSNDVSRALNMYRNKIVDFTDLDRHWLRPSYYARRHWLRDYTPITGLV